MRKFDYGNFKLWLLAAVIALLFFILGLGTWVSAGHYIPETPAPAPVKKFYPPKLQAPAPLAKYQPLLSGKLFFGTEKTTTGVLFSSKLVLWGLIHGNTALVGLDPQSNQNTWIVKAGDTVEGEKILRVGENSITVSNQTGEGEVFLKN